MDATHELFVAEMQFALRSFENWINHLERIT